MRNLQKSKILLFLALCLILSACTVNSLFTPQTSQGRNQGDLLLIGQFFRLQAGESIDGDIVGIGINLTIDAGAVVEGNITLIGSSLEIGGIVKGNLNLFAGSSHLESGAYLNGDINQFFHKIIFDHDAKVMGEINSFSFPGFPADQLAGITAAIMEFFKPGRWFFWQLTRVLAISFLALLAVILLKKPTQRIAVQVQYQPLINWGAGIFVFLATPIVALILIITICLSPIGILLVLALVLSYIYGWLALGLISGKLLQRWLRMRWSEETQAFLGSIGLGLSISMIGWIPCLGWIVNFMIGCVGLGAVILSRFGTLSEGGNPLTEPITIVNEPPKATQPTPPEDKH